MKDSLKQEFIRMIKSRWFLLGVFFTFGLCFLSEIVSGANQYTIMQVLDKMSRSEMAQEAQLYPAVVLRNAFSGYVTLFVPVVSALPLIQLLHTETQSGWKRIYMCRRSCVRYYWDKWLAGMLISGLMMLIVAVMFRSVMAAVIPGIDSEQLEMMGWRKYPMWLEELRSYLGIFCYGVFSAIPAIIISTFTNNMYFMICLPFMICYFWDVFLSNLIVLLRNYNAAGQMTNIMELLFSRAYLHIAQSVGDMLVEVIRGAAMIGVLLVIYIFFVKRKLDYGD